MLEGVFNYTLQTDNIIFHGRVASRADVVLTVTGL